MAKPTQMFAAYGLPCVTRGETSTGPSNLDTEVRARPGRQRRKKERKAKRIRRKDLIVKEEKTGRNKNSLRTARIFVSRTRVPGVQIVRTGQRRQGEVRRKNLSFFRYFFLRFSFRANFHYLNAWNRLLFR